jgi:hypothetical protein
VLPKKKKDRKYKLLKGNLKGFGKKYPWPGLRYTHS